MNMFLADFHQGLVAVGLAALKQLQRKEDAFGSRKKPERLHWTGSCGTTTLQVGDTQRNNLPSNNFKSMCLAC